jgi:transposase-like protein
MSKHNIRRRLTFEERQRCLDDYRNSGLTQREFAARSGICFSTLTLWIRKAKTARSLAAPSFLELPTVQPSSAVVVCRLVLPHGVSLEIPPGFPIQELQQLARLLLKS